MQTSANAPTTVPQPGGGRGTGQTRPDPVEAKQPVPGRGFELEYRKTVEHEPDHGREGEGGTADVPPVAIAVALSRGAGVQTGAAARTQGGPAVPSPVGAAQSAPRSALPGDNLRGLAETRGAAQSAPPTGQPDAAAVPDTVETGRGGPAQQLAGAAARQATPAAVAEQAAVTAQPAPMSARPSAGVAAAETVDPTLERTERRSPEGALPRPVPAAASGPVATLAMAQGDAAPVMVLNHDTATPAELSRLELSGSDRELPAAPVNRAAQTPMTVARAVAAQLAAGMRLDAAQPVEIRLDPKELGQVRMMLNLSDHGASVVMVAERTETLELMRRHIGALSQEFARLGYGDTNFSFAQDRGDDADTGSFADDAPAVGAEALDTAPEGAEPAMLLSLAEGLDVRL